MTPAACIARLSRAGWAVTPRGRREPVSALGLISVAAEWPEEVHFESPPACYDGPPSIGITDSGGRVLATACKPKETK